MQRARAEALNSARSWVTTPADYPPGPRRDGQRVRGVGELPGALWRRWSDSGEATPLHPELPFVQARIRFASGRVDRAAAQLRTALDTRGAEGFPALPGDADRGLADIAAAANVFAYQGDLDNAAKAIDLADQVRREVLYEPGWMAADAKGESWRRVDAR